MINKYILAVVIMIIFIIMFVILTPEKNIERWKNKITAFSSLAILATISIFLLNYAGDDYDRDRQMKLDLIEIMDDRLNEIDSLFMQNKDLTPLYENIYSNKHVSEEYYNLPIVQQMLSIMIRNIDDYFFLTEYNDENLGLNNIIRKWFKSDVVSRFYDENKIYYSEQFKKNLPLLLK